MLVSCSSCNRLHNRGETCFNKVKQKRTKEETYISKFRSTKIWQRKRDEIKARDKFLCQVCLLDNKYIFEKLSVHHIIPISTNWNKRLDNFNLITLCSHCHYMADNDEINSAKLLKIAAKNVATF